MAKPIAKKPYQISTYVPDKGYKKIKTAIVPHIFLDLDSEAMDSQTYPTLCTVCVKFPDGKSSVVHFSVNVSGSKVVAVVTAGGKTRDVQRSVFVPAIMRKYV